MPRYLNTDNGSVIDVRDAEAFIYERASNFERVPDVRPPAAYAPKPAPKKKASTP